MLPPGPTFLSKQFRKEKCDQKPLPTLLKKQLTLNLRPSKSLDDKHSILKTRNATNSCYKLTNSVLYTNNKTFNTITKHNQFLDLQTILQKYINW